MRGNSLTMPLVLVGLTAASAPAEGGGPGKGDRIRHDPSPAASWIPKRIRERLRGERGRTTQGPELQGGLLEHSIVRGAIDSQPGDSQTGSEFPGFRLGMRPFVVRVVGEMKDPCLPPATTLNLYELEFNGKNPCDGEPLAPEYDRPYRSACEQAYWEVYRGKAMAVEGGWTTGMSYVSSSGQQPFSTFSCLSGVVAKCIRLGYEPWEGEAQTELFQTCIRAMRGDYCGTGMSYTCNGTVVDYADARGIQTREANPSGEILEADWTPHGARCLNTARLPGCSAPVEQQRLLQVIAEECAANHHPIRIGGCRESCTEGETCGRPVRTWAVAGQMNMCETSMAYCPAPSSASR